MKLAAGRVLYSVSSYASADLHVPFFGETMFFFVGGGRVVKRTTTPEFHLQIRELYSPTGGALFAKRASGRIINNLRITVSSGLRRPLIFPRYKKRVVFRGFRHPLVWDVCYRFGVVDSLISNSRFIIRATFMPYVWIHPSRKCGWKTFPSFSHP